MPPNPKILVLGIIASVCVVLSCDDPTDNQIEPEIICRNMCYKGEACFGWEQFDQTLSGCLDICPHMTPSEAEPVQDCEEIEDCDSWLLCVFE